MSPPHPSRLRYSCRVALALVALLAIGASRATAASKTRIAAIGDPAPGGGVFAGPSFSGWTTAAGDGWIAFRGKITGGTTSEAIIAARETAPRTAVQVASKGQSAPGGGKFQQFFGRPAVNARGDVAFYALVNDPSLSDDPSLPTPAGVFLFNAATRVVTLVARSRQVADAGLLDIAQSLDPTADPNAIDLPQRTPALNDLGDVAFLSAVVPSSDGPSSAIFLRPSGGDLSPVVSVNDAFDSRQFLRLGPPALSASRQLVFHGAVGNALDPSDPGTEGIFAATGTAVSLLVGEGQPATCLNDDRQITAFADPIAVNGGGDMVFVASLSPTGGQSTADSVAAVLRYRAGKVQTIACPGQQFGHSCDPGAQPPAGTLTDFVLSTVGGSVPAAPALGPDGTVTFFASLDRHKSEAIVRSDGTSECVLTKLGGADADPAPTGGVYAAAASAPAVDAVGGVAFFARISGGSTIEAIVYRPGSGSGSTVVVGQAAPDSGFFAGPAFSDPAINDAGDVVFRAFVAGGPSSVGIFRAHGGQIDPLVRAGDPSPPAGAPFFDLSGRPSVNAAGTVAFSAIVAGQGPGIYIFGPAGKRGILGGDAAPQGGTFVGFGLNPTVNAAGMVAFRAIIRLPNRETQDGIFLAGPADIRLLAASKRPSPAGPNFLRMRDPVVTDVPSVFFNAPFGTTPPAIGNGLFFAQVHGRGPGIDLGSIAVEGKTQLADGTTVSKITASPAVDGAGDVAFAARRSAPSSQRDLGPAILRRTGSSLDLVVARDMPGPMGGTFKGFGQPAMGDAGHVVFLGVFDPQHTATPGFFVATGKGIEPYLQTGEKTPIGGRFQSFSSRVDANAHDEIAFLGSVGGGDARQGLFLASPTQLSGNLVLTLSGQASGRVGLRALLKLGRITNGVDPVHDGVTLAVGDSTGRVLWSSNVPTNALKRHGNRFETEVSGHRGRRGLHGLRLRVGKGGSIRVAAQSQTLNLTEHGKRRPVPPLSLTVQIGDDSGTVVIPCKLRRGGGRCRF